MVKTTEVISQPQVSTTTQIQHFLKMFIELSGALYVDDDGYVRGRRSEGEDDYVEISTGKDESKMLVIYGDNIKNFQEVVILNPFTESTILTPDREWFYSKLLNNTLSLNGTLLFRQLQLLALEGKQSVETRKEQLTKKGKRIKETASTAARETFANIELISPILNFITDAKMIEEFDLVVENIKDGEFLNVYYNRKDMTAKLHCALLNPDIENAYPNIRKKTWENWRKILEIVFGDFQKNYTIRAELIGCPQLDSTMKCWHALFSHTGKYFNLVGIYIDTDVLKEHIDTLQIYHSKAKWLTQVAVAAKAEDNASVYQTAQMKPSLTPAGATVNAGALKISGLPPSMVRQAPPPVPQYAQPLNVRPSSLGNTPYGGMALPVLTSANRTSPAYRPIGQAPMGTVTTQSGMSIDMTR